MSAMQLHAYNKRSFAFGLTWIEARDSAQDDIEASVGPTVDLSESNVYSIEVSRPKSKVPKGVQETEGADVGTMSVRGYVVSDTRLPKTFSAAAALAKQGRDGLFVVDLTDDEVWYCGIRDGVVVPSTDVIDTRDAALATVSALASGLDLTVFASETLSLLGSETFVIGAALRSSSSPALRPLSGRTSPVVPILIIAVVAGLGFFGYRMIFPPKPKLTPEQQQAMLRAAYVTNVSSAVKVLPASSEWVNDAFLMARKRLPPFITGWVLEGVSCTPTDCNAMYSVGKDSAFALSPMKARFGSALKVMPDGHSVSVAMHLSTEVISMTEPYLRSIQPAKMPLLDWVGGIPIRMVNTRIDGQLLDNNLGQQLGAAAAGMPPNLELEQASIKSEAYLDAAALRGVVWAGAVDGFVPVQIAWTPGNGQIPAVWRMTWERLHG
jgi:hypothetical protein